MRLKNGEVIFLWPLALHVLTAGYNYSDGSRHEAIDLRTNQGGSIVKPVYAAEDGTVDQTQIWDGHTKTGMQSYGTMIRIRHAEYCGQTLQTRYAHLSRLCVANGQQVKAGQLIGYTGQTGNVNGAHLHFEGDADAILAVCRARELDNLGLYVSGWSNDEHTLQAITIGPVTQGDADAILAECKARQLDKLGLYTSAWADEEAA